MSEMATVPVFACRVCGKPVYITHLSTQEADADAKKLKLLMQGLSKIALCDYHRAKRNWYASQGREAEFLANELNPVTVIYNVVDGSKLDYYGKNNHG
jgi:hypothetical protein